MKHFRALSLVALVALLPVQGCSDILEANDPDIILEANSATSALALRNGVLFRLAEATNGVQGADALFIYGGVLADEWRSGDTFVQRNNMDQRLFEPANTFIAPLYRRVNRIRVEAQAAIRGLRQYVPDSVALVGEMFALMAYSEVLVGEHFCNGAPLSSIDAGGAIVFGDPITNDSVFALAVIHADSALAFAAGRANVINLAAVVKGRALLDRNQFAAAATAVASVPLNFSETVTHSANSTPNQIYALNNAARRYTLVDFEGGVGLNYISANDPRLPRATGPDAIFDTALPLLVTRQGVYGQFGPVPIANGLEAKMIIAEALLRGGNATWLDTINVLRVNTALYPVPIPGSSNPLYTFTRGPDLTALTDPGTAAAREDILFRERAFWLFSTGHRLGDLRRLMRQFGRTEAQVFPTGAYIKGGTYGTALQLPAPFDETNNPKFTQCLDTGA